MSPNLPKAGPNQPNRNPNVSQWTMVALVLFRHGNFMLFVYFSFALGSQCKRGFGWNMGLKESVHVFKPTFVLRKGGEP